MAWGMKQTPEKMSIDPALYLRAMLNPFVPMGIAALILAPLTRMALLSLSYLSFVLPVTAIGYVIAVFVGKVFLHGSVTCPRWMGHCSSLPAWCWLAAGFLFAEIAASCRKTPVQFRSAGLCDLREKSLAAGTSLPSNTTASQTGSGGISSHRMDWRGPSIPIIQIIAMRNPSRSSGLPFVLFQPVDRLIQF
jgi:hypothetical protein